LALRTTRRPARTVSTKSWSNNVCKLSQWLDTDTLTERKDTRTRPVKVQLSRNRESLNELFVTSKISRKESAKDVKATLQNQLKQLGLDHVDLYLVHSPLLGKIPEVWKQMEAVKKEGLATSIGVSNFRRRHLEELIASAEEKPVVNQIEFNPLTIEEAQDVLDCCNEHGIKVAAYSPSSPITKFAGTAVDKATADVAKELSDKTGTSVNPGQVLLKWAQGKGAIVITTSSKTERMKEQVDAGRLPDLTSEQIESIQQAGIKSGIKRIYMTDTV